MRLIFQSVHPGDRLVVDDVTYKPGEPFTVTDRRGREILAQGDPQITQVAEPAPRVQKTRASAGRAPKKPEVQPSVSAGNAPSEKPEATTGEGQPSNPEAQGG